MRHRVLASALLAMVVAACGGDGKFTEPTTQAKMAAKLGPLAAIGTDSVTGATIETDLDDYPPGFAVNLKGSAWAPNETVHLFMSENPDTHDDVSMDVQADSTGAFAVHFYDVQETDLGVTFTLTATGQTSGSVATALFTDGNLQLQPNPTPNPFSPNGDGQADNLSITARNQGNGDVTSVFVSVRPQGATVSGAALRVFSIGTLTQNTSQVVLWDGRNAASLLQSDGNYSIRVYSTTDATQDEASANGQRLFNVTLDNTAPVVSNVVATPNAANVGASTPVTVTAVATDARSNIAGGKLTIDGGAPLTMAAVDGNFNQLSENLTFTIPGATVAGLASGPHQLCVVATDAASNTTTPAVCTTLTINNPNNPPTVGAGGPYTGNEGSAIAIAGTATDDGSIASVAWSVVTVPAGVTCSFGNANLLSTAVTCNDNAAVTIKLTATDNDGATSSANANVTVNNAPPTATFNAPASQPGGVGFAISLTAPADPSSVDQATGFTYAFDCGSGYAPFSGTSSASCPGAPPPSVTVKGTIRDKDGGVTEYTQSVAINNVAPLAGAGGPYSGNEGSSISLTGTGSDPDGGTVTFEWSTNAPAGTCTIVAPTSQNTSVNCNDNGSWMVSLKVTDDELASTTSSVALNVANVAPVIGAKTTGGSVNEGSMIAFAVSNVTDVSSADQTAGFTYAFACDGTTFGAYGNSSMVNCPAGNGPGSVTIAAKARDKDLGESVAVSSTFTVVNVAPIVYAGSATASLNEGGTFSRSGSFTDPGPDSWTATVDYGDGSGVVPLTLNGKTFSLSHTYPNDGVFTVTVTVDDGDGGTGQAQITVTVYNVLPNVNAGAGGTINEGAMFSGSGSFTDPGADTWTATVNYGDGSPAQALPLSGKNFSLSHTYTDDTGGPFTVTVTVNDDDGYGTGTATVVVLNVRPLINLPLNIPVNPIPAGTPVALTWTFADPGADSWQCKISWDLPTPPAPIVFDPAFASTGKSCSATKTLSAGIYTVTVNVTDDDGGYDQQTATAYIVVYDPNAGFVTGGGWINSLPGAYAPDLELAGKANFGFVSKYKKGQTVPDGNTEFQFHAATLNFKSDTYEWLVVSGSKAQFKGTGTINGQGKYGFILTATDGQVNGGGGVDKFRMKIWIINPDNTAGDVVYDNQMGAAVDANPTTALGGGSINIQAK